MDNDNQIFIPDSFSTLHATPGGRPTLPRAELVARYELCEDMANALVEHCQAIHFRDGVDEAEVLQRCLKGLLVEPAVLTPPQARWVVTRTAELLGWPLQFDDEEGDSGRDVD
jgi:hypothetical protein